MKQLQQTKKQKGIYVRLWIGIATIVLLGGLYILQNVLQESVPGAKQVMVQGGYEYAK